MVFGDFEERVVCYVEPPGFAFVVWTVVLELYEDSYDFADSLDTALPGFDLEAG